MEKRHKCCYIGFKTLIVCCIGRVKQSTIDTLRDLWTDRKPVDPMVHDKMLQLVRLYLVVGGMPAAVAKYIETNNLQQVLSQQIDIVNLYRRDISKYAETDKLKIKEIFDLIPSELDAKNKRFILKSLNEHAKFDRYKDSFLWLKDAGVSLPVYNVEELRIPLKLAECRNLFKLFANDVGLLASQFADGIQLRILSGDSNINFGSIYENFVAQELAAHGFDTYYNSKRFGELDFVIVVDGKIMPIEVKSGKDYERHRALDNVLERDLPDVGDALVLSNANLSVAGRVTYIPIYMLMFVKRENRLPTHYAIDLTGL